MFFDVEKNRLYLPADSILYFGSSYDANSDPIQNHKVPLEKGFLKFKKGHKKPELYSILLTKKMNLFPRQSNGS